MCITEVTQRPVGPGAVEGNAAAWLGRVGSITPETGSWCSQSDSRVGQITGSFFERSSDDAGHGWQKDSEMCKHDVGKSVDLRSV